VSTRINLATILAPLERYSEAVAHLQRAAQLQPESVQVWRQLGAALLKAKRPAESEAALRRALAIRPDPAVAYELALVLQAGERFQDAALVLRKVVEATPDHVDAAYQLGATLQRLGDMKGARQALQHYLSVSAGRQEQAARVAEVQAALAPAKAPTQPVGWATPPPTPEKK
jgi:tetratricopeptide (TPR) repeat protein